VGRHREFDEDAVLHALTRLFWRQGFRGTSIRDLSKETGLAESRLYNAFGDKRQMFLLALDRYRARVLRFASQVTESEDPLGAIRDYVLAIAKGLARQEDFRGCLITNTMIELAAHDQEIREQLSATFDMHVEIFRKALANARDQGQLDNRADVQELARYLVQNLEGLRVTSRSNPGEKYLVDTAEFALSLLPVTRGSARHRKSSIRTRAAGTSKTAKQLRKD
jgi:TetR/AcrR family transcriptional repressor of nem operon